VETLVERCAGLDVHTDSVTACVRVPDGHAGRHAKIRRFTTTTAGLGLLAEWLGSFGVTRVGDGLDRVGLEAGLAAAGGPDGVLAFVLHDMFAVSFEEIAALLGRLPAAARQLASRARRRVHGEAKVPDADLSTQWQVVDAFLAAARGGDFDRLVALLDPDVVLKADRGSSGVSVVRGAESVAGQWRAEQTTIQRVLVNGAAGIITMRDGRPFSVVGLTVTDGKIAEFDILADPERLATLDLTLLEN
jgi:hypothetical protein